MIVKVYSKPGYSMILCDGTDLIALAETSAVIIKPLHYSLQTADCGVSRKSCPSCW